MYRARTYLDWNATAPLRAEARAAMVSALDLVGNPSSVHAEGRKARAVVEDAREQIASVLGVRAGDVYFTSGATEGAAWALTPHAVRGAGPLAKLLVSATEHACVLQGHRFAAERVQQIGVDKDGRLDLVALQARLTGGGAMIAVQAANNETGVLQPTARIAEIARETGSVFVADIVQLAGRASCDAREIGADVILLSGHKIGGPKGVGALVIANNRVQPEPLIRGGGQEKRQRSGTENVAAIAGFGAAFAAAAAEAKDFALRAAGLQRRLEEGLRAIRPDTIIFGDVAKRLPNTSCFAVAGIPAEMALIALDLDGTSVSSGSACSSGKVGASHVLAAMGVPDALARCAIRVSTGRDSREADIDQFLATWAGINSRHADRKVA